MAMSRKLALVIAEQLLAELKVPEPKRLICARCKERRSRKDGELCVLCQVIGMQRMGMI